MNKLTISNLYVSFGDNCIFDNMSIEFSGGKIYGFEAPNGIGKTVLLKTISGFNTPNRGTIDYDGEILYKDIEFPRDTRVVFDNSFFGHLTGFKNLQYINSIKENISDYDIMTIMKQLELDPYSKTPVKKYSTGMIQKLRFAQAMLQVPQILFLDEIFNGLDKKSVVTVTKLIKSICKNHGTTIFMTSHIKEHLYKLCDYVYYIDERELKVKNEEG